MENSGILDTDPYNSSYWSASLVTNLRFRQYNSQEKQNIIHSVQTSPFDKWKILLKVMLLYCTVTTKQLKSAVPVVYLLGQTPERCTVKVPTYLTIEPLWYICIPYLLLNCCMHNTDQGSIFYIVSNNVGLKMMEGCNIICNEKYRPLEQTQESRGQGKPYTLHVNVVMLLLSFRLVLKWELWMERPN